MKFFVSILLVALLSFTFCLYLPWWSIAIAAFIVTAFIEQKPAFGFLTGFTALFLLWTIMAFAISTSNHHLLARRMAPLIIKSNSALLLAIVTGLTGGLVAGFGALTGSLVNVFKQQQVK
jgi:uncharacterized membrane protein